MLEATLPQNLPRETLVKLDAFLCNCFGSDKGLKAIITSYQLCVFLSDILIEIIFLSLDLNAENICSSYIFRIFVNFMHKFSFFGTKK